MIFLLTASTAGYSIMSKDSDSDSTVTDSGIIFYRTSGAWKAIIGEQTFQFQNLPSEVSNVEISGEYNLGNYANVPIYFNSLGVGASEILININDYVQRYQEACILDSPCEKDVPSKNCSTSNVIIFETGNSNKVYQDENCVYISGDEVKGADAFLYKTLGII